MRSKNLILVVLALASVLVLAIAGTASAEMVLNVNSIQGINMGVTYPLESGTGTRSATFKAGEFSFTLFDTTSAQSWDSPGYCVDIYDHTGVPDSFPVVLASAAANPDWLEAAWLMDNFAPGVDGDLPSGVTGPYTDNQRRAATQLAIWEAVFDGYDIYSGNFRLNATSAVGALAQAMLDDLQALSGGPDLALGSLYFVAQSCTKQDQILKIPPSGDDPQGTPEPGTLLLMGSAAGALGWWRRKKGLR